MVGAIARALMPYLLGAAALAAVAGSIWLYGVNKYNAGYADADSKCQAEAIRSQLDAMTADRDAARSAEADAKARADRMRDEARAEMEGVAEYVEELKKRPPAAACRLTGDDLRWFERMRNNSKANAAGSRTPAEAAVP